MRYDRQILMPEIGIEGQKKLERAVVTVIGCGGLGSPVLTYLAQAGAGDEYAWWTEILFLIQI